MLYTIDGRRLRAGGQSVGHQLGVCRYDEDPFARHGTVKRRLRGKIPDRRGFALTGLCEEGGLRGYGFVQLSRAISFWPAAILLSTLILVLHIPHKNETLTGLAQVGLVGIVFAYSFLRSGGLWFALGCHASWDYAQSFVYGVPDSGVIAEGALLHPTLHGPDWLTGGATGPEASVLVLPVLALQGVIVHLAFRGRMAQKATRSDEK